MPRYIDPESWKAAVAVIRHYPEMYVELADGEEAILSGMSAKDGVPGRGCFSDPTAVKAIRLASARRRRLNRLCEAVNWCLSQLRPEHRRVVCLRFWGVDSAGAAFRLVREGQAPWGLRYASRYVRRTVETEAGYSARQAKRIVGRFIRKVCAELKDVPFLA